MGLVRQRHRRDAAARRDQRAETTLASPPGLARTTGTFVQVALTGLDQRYPSWGAPVTVYFQRQPQNWKLVGIERLP